MSHVHAFSCIHTFNSIYFDIFVFGAFLIFFLSFSLSLPLTLVASWHLSISLFRPGTLFVSEHLLLLFHLTPLLLTSSSVMRRPNWTSWRTFHDATFIWNSKSFCQISLTLTYPLSSTVGVESHFVASQSRALP